MTFLSIRIFFCFKNIAPCISSVMVKEDMREDHVLIKWTLILKKRQLAVTACHILAVLMDMIAFQSRWEGCVWQQSSYNWAVGRRLVWRENCPVLQRLLLITVTVVLRLCSIASLVFSFFFFTLLCKGIGLCFFFLSVVVVEIFPLPAHPFAICLVL